MVTNLGVLQGSILGLLLSCTSAVSVLINFNAHVYSEDTQIYYLINHTNIHNTSNTKINNDLKELESGPRFSVPPVLLLI